jgi:hypothetical protein
MKHPKLVVSESIMVARPIGEVFSALTEPQHAKHWISLVFDADLHEPGPITVGTSAWYTVKIFGRRVRVEGHWLRYDVPHESIFQTTVSPIDLNVVYRCAATPDGTHTKMIVEFGNGIFFGITNATVQKIMSHTFKHDLNLLKTYMEHAPAFFKRANGLE